jgi:hypothetical protein
MSERKSNTVIGLFEDIDQARAATQELLDAGFDNKNVNLVANAAAQEYTELFDDNGHYKHLTSEGVHKHVAGAAKVGGVGAAIGGLGGLLLGLAMLSIPGVGPVVAAGPLAATLVGAGAGAAVGGMIGGFTDAGVTPVDAEYYAEAIRRGCTSVVVKADVDRAGLAAEIINRHKPIDIHERVQAWQKAGWQKFDPAARPLSVDEIATERRSYLSSEPVGPA